MVQLAIRCPHLELQGVPSDRSADGSISGTGRAVLDRVLELLERTQRSPTEMRVLLRLLDREASLAELADALGQAPVEIRRAGRSLAMLALVRWQHVGRNKETRLGITAAGLAAMRALLTAGGEKAAVERTASC
jgi:N-acyl-D-aspartate/D-glutamate deacylase